MQQLQERGQTLSIPLYSCNLNKKNKTKKKQYDLVEGGKRKKTMSKIIQQQCCAVASVWRQTWA